MSQVAGYASMEKHVPCRIGGMELVTHSQMHSQPFNGDKSDKNEAKHGVQVGECRRGVLL